MAHEWIRNQAPLLDSTTVQTTDSYQFRIYGPIDWTLHERSILVVLRYGFISSVPLCSDVSAFFVFMTYGIRKQSEEGTTYISLSLSSFYGIEIIDGVQITRLVRSPK